MGASPRPRLFQPGVGTQSGAPMRIKGLTIALAVIAALGFIKLAHAGELRAPSGGGARGRYYRRRRPLQVDIYARRRRGGYSYGVPDIIGTNGRSPPPYMHVRQTPSGPFDSGFFF